MTLSQLAPYLASIILGAIALLYYALVLRFYLQRQALELKHKAWLRIAIIFTIVAIALIFINRPN